MARSKRVHRSRIASPGPGRFKPADTPVRMALRATAGIVFITLGQMKFFDSILLGTTAISLPTGPEGFAQYLAAIGVPFPLLNAYMVCLVEMICGLGLVLSAFLPAPALFTRLAALPLFGDMVVATFTVGLRNAMGQPVLMGGIPVTQQAWRLPLEVFLLLTTLLLLWRPLPRPVQAQEFAAPIS
ncbi:DoxX family protein [Stigmatella aurantiaca]|nr:DoxX family protein [Stigmatella aurantiaca]